MIAALLLITLFVTNVQTLSCSACKEIVELIDGICCSRMSFPLNCLDHITDIIVASPGAQVFAKELGRLWYVVCLALSTYCVLQRFSCRQISPSLTATLRGSPLVRSQYLDDAVCQDAINTFAPTVFPILVAGGAKTNVLCELIKACPRDAPKALSAEELQQLHSLHVALGSPQATKRRAIPRARSREHIRILHVTDIHLDHMFVPGGNTQCNEPLCCRSKVNHRADRLFNSLSANRSTAQCDCTHCRLHLGLVSL